MGYLGEKLRAALAQDPSEPAIQFAGDWFTWGDIGRLIGGLDGTLSGLGLGDGAAIACVLRNNPPQVAALMGLVASGRCVVTLNALTPDETLAEDILAMRPSAIVATAMDWTRPALRSAAASICAAGVELTQARDCPVTLVPGLETVGAGPHQAPLPGVAIQMLTSGTTGRPKRVPLRTSVLERQLIDAAGAPPQRSPVRAAASVMAAPVVHLAGVWGVFSALANGQPICLLEKFNVTDWRRAIVEHRPSVASAPPVALRMILDADIPKADLASLNSLRAGTAALDPAIVDEFLRRYDLPVLSNYGATEFAGGVASWSLQDFRQSWTIKRGAVGRVHAGIEARVVQPDSGAPVPFGDEGILELKGFAMAEGGEWVRTSDRAVLDEDRFLWIRGRADNAIVRGGFKVHPDQVVEALQAHPAIREASVVGVPHRRLGHAPVAALIVEPGALAPSDADLGEWVRARLAPYCAPVAYKFVSDLPRTPSLKVSTPAVRQLFEADDLLMKAID